MNVRSAVGVRGRRVPRSARLLAVVAALASLLAACGGSSSSPRGASSPPMPSPSSGAVRVVAVGDIHAPGDDDRADATAALAQSLHPTAVLGLGDYQYQEGTCAAFTAEGAYDSDWGRLNPVMYPTFGPGHDWDGTVSDPQAAAYMSGDCPGQTAPQSAAARLLGGTVHPDQPYSFRLGTWHVISLPSLCDNYAESCDSGRVLTWLRRDLADHPARCTLAYWHEAYFTSPTAEHDASTGIRRWVQALYDAGVDVVVQGHNHDYERFAPLAPDRTADAKQGLTAYVVGTGGIGFYPFTGTAPGSVARQADTLGVLALDLKPAGWRSRFVSVPEGSYTDQATGRCH